MQHVKITNNLFLNRQTIKNDPRTDADPGWRPPVNHIWIYDRSGSMYHELPNLAADLIKRAYNIVAGDTISIAYFSGRGEYNFILKGFKISAEGDYHALEDAINRNKTTIGLTCFSEILSNVPQVCDDLVVFTDRFALTFFTDGHPTDERGGLTDIRKAVKALNGRITSALFVGYGNYYNRELMTEMATGMGGTLIHSAKLDQFSLALDAFIKGTDTLEARKEVEIVGDPSTPVFTLNNKDVQIYSLDGRKVLVQNTVDPEVHIYYLSSRPIGSEAIRGTARPFGYDSPWTEAAYAAALVANQAAKSDLALDCLAKTGDVYFIDGVANAFTNAEYGKVETEIKQAVFDNTLRGRGGFNFNYLPSPDAFCLLDLLDILQADPEARFYPYHPSFDYSRIGRGTKTAEGYPRFKHDDNVNCTISSLVWNDKKLNLSVLARIPGTIELPPEAAKLGFSSPYPTYIWRNYALVKDGMINVERLPITASNATWVSLKSTGLLNYIDYMVDGILDLTKIPVINRSIADGKTSAAALCQLVAQELEHEAHLKVYKWLKESFDPEGKLEKRLLTIEQEEFLLKCGVTKNGFAPPSTKEEPTDKYLAKEFEIKAKGFSSWPKVDAVIEKMQLGKKLTPAEVFISKPIHAFANTGLAELEDIELGIAWLDTAIVTRKEALRRVRSDIQRTKFAVILGKKWFDEFSSRENCNIKVNDLEFSLSIREVEVLI